MDNTGLLHAHWGLRYIVVFLLLAATVRALTAMASGKPWGKLDDQLGKWLLVFTHVQLIIGLVVYFTGGWHNHLGMMSDATLRYKSLEHPLIMLIAVVLITLGRSRGKRKSTDAGKHKFSGIMWLIALILILSRIPGNSWLNIPG